MSVTSVTARWGCACILFLVFLLAGPGSAQQPDWPSQERILPRNSAPVAPQPMKCAITEWQPKDPKYALELTCPPEEVFAPLRLVLWLGWDSDEIPTDLQNLMIAPGGLAKVQMLPKRVSVLLGIARDVRGRPGRRWVSFNLVKVGVIVEN